MILFGSFIRTARTRQTFSHRITLRSFTATAQNNKYQLPIFKKQKGPKPIMSTTTLKGQPLDRPTMDSMLRRRMFYTPSFEIYGGVAGLYDYGPVSCTSNLSCKAPCFGQDISKHHVAILAWKFAGDSSSMMGWNHRSRERH